MEEQGKLRDGTWQAQRTLRLADLLYVVSKRRLLIAICGLLGLAMGLVSAVVSCLPEAYTVTSSIAVTAQNRSGLFTSQSPSPGSNDIYLAENLVDAVCYVLKSDRGLTAAAQQLELPGVSPQDISQGLDMTRYKGTQIIEITLRWPNAQEGVEILQAIHAAAPDLLADTLKIGSVCVIDPPAVRRVSADPNPLLLVYLTLVGTLLGVGLAVLELLLRPTLLRAEEMERRFRVEVLEEIPFVPRPSRFEPRLSDSCGCLACILKVRLSKLRHPCVYLTSAAPGEGSTTLTACLASQLAEDGAKVLLVDLASQAPRLASLFSREAEDSRCHTPPEEPAEGAAITHLAANLDLLSGPQDAAPRLLSSFRQDYDIVLMDTAPIGQSAQTMGLNQLADGALLVVRFDGVSLNQLQHALNRLEKSGVPLLGCVVNGVKKPLWETGPWGGGRMPPRDARENRGIPEEKDRSKGDRDGCW